jgi:hypothetical protein
MSEDAEVNNTKVVDLTWEVKFRTRLLSCQPRYCEIYLDVPTSLYPSSSLKIDDIRIEEDYE